MNLNCNYPSQGSFLDPQLTKDGKRYGPARCEVIGKESGVSVYEAHKNINGTYSPVLPFPTNEIAFNSFIYYIKYFTGNKYLVTGDLLDETGTDGEPLIKNVKILKKL